MRVVGIIPARGGSKRLPNKNLRPVGGKPMIAHTCEAAIESGIFDAVYVNTDSAEIAMTARNYGVSCPALRPARLAADDTPSRDAILWILDVLAEKGEVFDAIMILQPTSPLRSADDIRDAWQMYLTNAPCAVKSVTATTPASWVGRITRSGQFEAFVGDEWIYKLNGAIYIFGTEDYLAGVTPRKMMAFPMPADRSVDVDTIDDLRLAEVLTNQEGVAQLV